MVGPPSRPRIVDLPGVKEHALGERGLARVDVGGDADVAYFCQALHADCFLTLHRGRPIQAGPDRVRLSYCPVSRDAVEAIGG